MKKTLAAIIIVGALLVGCAAPVAGPPPIPSRGAFAPAATTVPPTEVPTARPTYTPTSAPVPTATLTREPTSTPTPVPTYTLSGLVFFDYNGNGLRDDGEPPIEGVPILVAGLSTISGPDGSYSLAGVPGGSQQVYVESPTQEPATAFRYTNRFLGWVDIPAYEMNGVSVPAQHLPDTELQTIGQPLGVTLSGDQDLDIGLMQGFLTLPFAESTNQYLWSYVDLDHRQDHIRNYANESIWPIDPYTDINSPGVRSGTSDNHCGIDYEMSVGTPLLSMAKGTVVQATNEYNYFRVLYEIGLEVYVISYEHDDVVLVSEGIKSPSPEGGTELLRGQIGALSGDYNNGRHGGTHPHVHVSIWKIPSEWVDRWHWYVFEVRHKIPSGGKMVSISEDPYRDVLDPNSLSFWTLDNNPQSPF